jgi:hypothetical protein
MARQMQSSPGEKKNGTIPIRMVLGVMTLGQCETILQTFGDETARKNENMGGTHDNQSQCSPMFQN